MDFAFQVSVRFGLLVFAFTIWVMTAAAGWGCHAIAEEEDRDGVPRDQLYGKITVVLFVLGCTLVATLALAAL